MLKKLFKKRWVAIVAAFAFGLMVPKVWTATGDFLAYNYGGTDIYRLQTNGDIWPGSDSTSDIGSSALAYATGFFDVMSLVDTITETTATPARAGDIARDSSNSVWISTGTSLSAYVGIHARTPFELINATSTVPTVVGQIAFDNTYRVYIATATAGTQPWVKIGTQTD